MYKFFNESTKKGTYLLNNYSITKTPFCEEIAFAKECVLYMTHSLGTVFTNYKDEFNIKTGELVCSYKMGNISVKRKYFTAVNENAFCVMIKSTKPVTLNYKLNEKYKAHIICDGRIENNSFKDFTSLEIILAEQELNKSYETLFNTNRKRLKKAFENCSFDIKNGENISAPVMKYNKSAELFSVLFNLGLYLGKTQNQRDFDVSKIYLPDADVFDLIDGIYYAVCICDEKISNYCINRIIDEFMLSTLCLKRERDKDDISISATICFAEAVTKSIVCYENDCLHICTALPKALAEAEFSLEGIDAGNGCMVSVKHTKEKTAIELSSRSTRTITVKVKDSKAHKYSVSSIAKTLFVYHNKEIKRYTNDEYSSIFKERS